VTVNGDGRRWQDIAVGRQAGKVAQQLIADF
jgi:hypothetical protein